ncbi:MAG: hypothetical protein JWP97_3731 [Labilithrix sp.]|nr:hypothetical protein [Labilithrix sp.]
MRTDEHRTAAELAAGYTKGHRLYELGAIVGTLGSGTWLLVRILRCDALSGWWVPLAALVGILMADFMSGFVHWLFDSWGSVDTPIVGKLAIRTFRHHHVDEKAITHHDFVETNGHNFGLSMLPASVGLLVVRDADTTLPMLFVGMTLLALVVFNATTSQVHKWAHLESRPRWVTFLQRIRLINSPEHHALHHAAPYNRNYCITLGWMNGPLQAVRFFETLEWLVTAITGAVPRVDDLGEVAAVELATMTAAREEDLAGPAPSRDRA